jgi:hypothetical protein
VRGERREAADPFFLYPFPPALDKAVKTESEMMLERLCWLQSRLIVAQKCAKSIPPLVWRVFTPQVLEHRP